jgi:hypothetical protein
MYQWGDGRATIYGLSPSLKVVPGVMGNNGGYNQAQLNSINARNVQINFVSKRIRLDLAATPWVTDYQVKVNLLHCTPLSESHSPGADMRNSCQTWVQKYKDYFVICVAWAGTNLREVAAGNFLPWEFRNAPEKFAGFAQPQMPLLGGGPWATYRTDAAGYSVNVQPADRAALFADQMLKSGQSTGAATTAPEYFNGVVPLLYPSIQWEVVGIANDFTVNSMGSNGGKMRTKDPVVITG